LPVIPQLTKKRPQQQGPMSRSILLYGQADIEADPIVFKCGEPFSQSSGTGEQIYDRHTKVSR
jgi:hypothetical protein